MKSVWKHFDHIFPSLWGKMISKISLLLKFEIIGVFVNTLTADYTYPFPDCCNLPFPIHIAIIWKTKNFFSVFCSLYSFFMTFKIVKKKKKILRANVFLKLQTVKDLVWALSKKSRSRPSFDSQLVKVSQTLLKSAWEHFDHLSWWVWGRMSWKTSPLLKFLMIGVFVNTLTPDSKYPFLDCDNLPFPIQMQLC